MNNISDIDIIFDFDCDNPRAFSYFGWEFSNSHAFYNYMIGYKTAADATYEAFKKAILSGNNEVADTVCYPLVYLYRHVAELMLKYSFMELKRNRSNIEIENYLNKGHNLINLWNNVRPDFERLSKRLNVTIDISAIDHYIANLSLVDYSSMAYRYPIKKSLNRFHDKDLHLNVPQLKERMDAFYDYMNEVIFQLSKHMEDDTYNHEFDKLFTEAIYKSMPNIKMALERINKNIKQYKEKSTETVEMDHSCSLSLDKLYEEKNSVCDWMSSFSEQEKSVLLLLFYTGRQIPLNKLAADSIERRKDVIKLTYGNSHNELKLDSSKSRSKDDCFEKNIALGGYFSKRNIELTLSELGIQL